MHKVFPYTNARNCLAEFLEKALPNGIKSKSEIILSLHLREDTLAMPNMSPDQLKDIREKIVKGDKLDDVCKELYLENTKSKRGMFRVLARTHLNRSGINHVSMGHFDKTSCPRILNFIDTIDLEQDAEKIQRELIANWLKFAENHRGTEFSNEGLDYNDKAYHALKTLNDASGREINCNLMETNVTAPKLSKELEIDLGWCRIVSGIMTGLNYLNFREWDLYDQVSKTDLSYENIHKLIKECQKNVSEYGYALAGSFLADLGGPSFVKDDTHVKACMYAISDNLDTPEKRVKAVIESAHSVGVQPRILDKIMYIAGSGNLYLIGVKLKDSQSIKKRFIEELTKML
ncbi:MAG: hypothetical protein WC649_05020 [Desulfobacteria bacterium]